MYFLQDKQLIIAAEFISKATLFPVGFVQNTFVRVSLFIVKTNQTFVVLVHVTILIVFALWIRKLKWLLLYVNMKKYLYSL